MPRRHRTSDASSLFRRKKREPFFLDFHSTHIVCGENNLSDLWIAGSKFNLQTKNKMQNDNNHAQRNEMAREKKRTTFHTTHTHCMRMRHRQFYRTHSTVSECKTYIYCFCAAHWTRNGNRLNHHWNANNQQQKNSPDIWTNRRFMMSVTLFVKACCRPQFAYVISEFNCHSNVFCIFCFHLIHIFFLPTRMIYANVQWYNWFHLLRHPHSLAHTMRWRWWTFSHWFAEFSTMHAN